jgi:hypothetical protein
MEQTTTLISPKIIEKLNILQKQLEIMRDCELELHKIGVKIKTLQLIYPDDFFRNVLS